MSKKIVSFSLIGLSMFILSGCSSKEVTRQYLHKGTKCAMVLKYSLNLSDYTYKKP